MLRWGAPVVYGSGTLARLDQRRPARRFARLRRE